MTRRHRIDLDQFDTVVSQMADFEKAMEGAEKDIAAIAHGLASSWKGAGADAFAVKVSEWTAAAKTSHDELTRLRVAGESIITNYRNAFRANAQMLSGLVPGAEAAKAAVTTSNDVDARDRAGRTALHYAAASNGKDYEQAKRLLAGGADVEARDQNGLTPLLMAAQYSNSEAIVRLLISAGADVHAEDNGGNSALMLALWRGKSAELARVFLEAGCDPHQPDKHGQTPIGFANGYGTDEMRALFAEFT